MITLTIGDLYDRCVQYYGDRIALTYKNRSLTYREMGYQANCLVTALNKLGLRKGDRVGFLMANCPEYVCCEYAVAKLGATRVPLAVLLNPNDHIYMLNLVECNTIIYHEKMADRIRGMLPKLETVKNFICVAEDATVVMEGHLHLQTLVNENEPSRFRADLDPEDLAGIYFTGGTTGKPKGVMLSHRAWVYTILIEMLEFDFAREEVFAYLTPLTHAGGCLLLPVLLRSGRCVIMDHFDPGEFLQTVEREQVTITFLVPTMIYVLLDHPDLTKYRLDSLRNIIYGASAIAPERLKQAIATLGPIFTQLFGQTEAPMAFSVLPREDHIIADPVRERQVFASAGRPTFHCEVRLVDDDGKDVELGQPGEIITRCANMMSGYYKNPEATRDTIRDGWLYTGDIAKRDEQGFIYIVDRKKDMIISGGFNIYPREIEDVLFEHPAVKDTAVIGIPHDKWGEEVKAIVVLREKGAADEQELIAFVKSRKGSLVAPKSVEFWDSIPLTNLGKANKKIIRSRFWEGHERQIS